MEIKHKQFLVVGLGKSGLSAARFLTRRGGRVTVTDRFTASELGAAASEAARLGCRLELGGHRESIFGETDCIVLSPGVPHTLPPIVNAGARGVEILGEFELASRFIREPIVAVTGTNGKTTVSSMIGAMLSASGRSVFVGGNIGNPLIEHADSPAAVDVVVAEISSFQLDTIRDFRPRVAVLLNITEDHLDRYPDFEAYARSKMKIFKNQKLDDVAVVNGNDSRIMSMSEQIQGRRWIFHGRSDKNQIAVDGARLDGRNIRFSVDSIDGKRIDMGRMQLEGRHNMENTAAAALAAYAAGATWEGILQIAIDFPGLPHRMEYTEEIASVRFINDSKATNVDAVARALESFDAPVILIMGGRDKSGNFALLRERIGEKVKKLILLGEAADTIQTALGDQVENVTTSNMKSAVAQAYRSAEPGDVVLLSPGCASFDMYSSYAYRGDDFKQAVRELKHEQHHT